MFLNMPFQPLLAMDETEKIKQVVAIGRQLKKSPPSWNLYYKAKNFVRKHYECVRYQKNCSRKMRAALIALDALLATIFVVLSAVGVKKILSLKKKSESKESSKDSKINEEGKKLEKNIPSKEEMDYQTTIQKASKGYNINEELPKR